MGKKRIGVFDSGIGGITILNYLVEAYPQDDFLFVADTAYCPYGTKTPQEIHDRVRNVTHYLHQQGVQAIVVACNTATAHLWDIPEAFDLPIVGVIEPTVKQIENLHPNNQVLLLATDATVSSGVYQKILSQYTTFAKGCSIFVEPIEAGQIQCPASYQLVNNHLQEFKNRSIEIVILGCTHFPLIAPEVQEVFPKAQLVNSIKPVTEELQRFIKPTSNSSEQRVIQLITTGKKEELISKIPWFKHPYIIKEIDSEL